MPIPPATEAHRPIPHHEIVRALIETLGFRHIGVVHDDYAVSPEPAGPPVVLAIGILLAGETWGMVAAASR